MFAGGGKLPDISQNMSHPAAGVIEYLRRALSALHLLLCPFDKGEMQFRQVGGFRRPEVHLQVDVQMIIAVPRCAHRIRPQALQIGREQTGTGGGDKQVTPELKIEGGKSGVVLVLLEGKETFINRHILPRTVSQIQFHTVKQFAIGGGMFLFQCSIVFLLRFRKQAGGMIGEAVLVEIVGRHAHKHKGFGSMADGQRTVAGRKRPALGKEYADTRQKLHALRFLRTRAVRQTSLHQQVAAVNGNLVMFGTVHAQGKTHSCSGLQTDDTQIAGERSKRLAGIGYISFLERERGGSLFQVQRPSVVRNGRSIGIIIFKP
ncbi:hypothetical protein Barb6_03255 [Bacteroidales bacterium Barb6]|nr:hypothetical protein Barb6_03255 [Bacteroidales bacterium Barb6]